MLQCFGTIVVANDFAYGSDRLVCSDEGKWTIEDGNDGQPRSVADAACPERCPFRAHYPRSVLANPFFS